LMLPLPSTTRQSNLNMPPAAVCLICTESIYGSICTIFRSRDLEPLASALELLVLALAPLILLSDSICLFCLPLHPSGLSRTIFFGVVARALCPSSLGLLMTITRPTQE